MQCENCLLESGHPFGIFFDEKGICSGCNAFSERKNSLACWDSIDLIDIVRELLISEIGCLPGKVIVPFDADGETWYVLDLLTKLNINVVVTVFNAQYHDDKYYEILSACMENFDCDFISLSLPIDLIRWCVAEEVSIGSAHIRKLEIFGMHAAALYIANCLNIKHIFGGPNQQSEVVGNHSYIIKNQMKGPAFKNIILGSDLLQHVSYAIQGINSEFSKSFNYDFINKELNLRHWHYLSDYIFWDSLSINNNYGTLFEITPRNVEGFGPCWQASSSSLKLEFADLMRLINIGSSKITSYLSRDIRFGRISRLDAQAVFARYINKEWDLSGIVQFSNSSVDAIVHSLDLLAKSRKTKFYSKGLLVNKGETQSSFNQILYPRFMF